jgi:hypothetical protein
MKHFSMIMLAACILLAPYPAIAQFSARDFFIYAPASTFYTEDEMSNEDKTAIIKKGFQALHSFSCSEWGVAEETSQSLMLRYCKDSFVSIRVYPSTVRAPVVVVQSSRSSGRASDLQFFRVNIRSKKLTNIPPHRLQTIGIEPVTENELISETDKFKNSAAEKAALLLDDDGSLRASVDTWMNPRWQNRELAYNVIFVWNGARFQKRVVSLTLR